MRRSLFSAIGTAAVVAATYATPSWAQTVALGGTPTQYAREALDGNPELTLRNDSGRDKVNITYATAPGIVARRTADITFALNGGATFAAAPTALVLSEGGTTSSTISAKISQTFVSGSAAGSSSVTYRVSTVSGLSAANTVFQFSVPKLSNAASILRAPDSGGTAPALTMRVTITPSSDDVLQTSSWTQFPAEGSAATVGVVTLAQGADLVVLASITPAPGATSTAPVISLSDRTSLTAPVATGAVGTVRAISGFPGGASRNGAVIGKVTLSYTEFLRPPDGTTASLTPGASDNLIVTVRGDFEDGDILIFTPDTVYATSRIVSISAGGGTATHTLSGSLLSTTARDRTFYYFPASGTIGQKAFSFTYSVRWQAANLQAREISAGTTRVQYAGIQTMAHAYAIPGPSNADQGNLRIRCQTEGPCAVFFDCLDQDGGRIGDGSLQEISVPGRSVRFYQSKTSLPEVLGVPGWTGRLSCNIMSMSDISVQLLVRSGSTGTLTNNTYISGVAPNP